MSQTPLNICNRPWVREKWNKRMEGSNGITWGTEKRGLTTSELQWRQPWGIKGPGEKMLTIKRERRQRSEIRTWRTLPRWNMNQAGARVRQWGKGRGSISCKLLLCIACPLPSKEHPGGRAVGRKIVLECKRLCKSNLGYRTLHFNSSSI